MKILHIPCKSTLKVDLSQIKSKLKGKILLFTTVQYVEQIDEMRKQLGAENCSVIKPKDSHAKYAGQILGCTKLSKDEISGFDAILFVGDGLFHPIALSNEDIDVYCYNPKSNHLQKLDETHFKNIEKKKKLGLNTFYRSKKIGVLISTKPGQKRLDAIDVLKKNYPDKEFFGILFDTIDFSRLLDFNFIECFVNTACPRIGVDDELPMPCINISDLEELKYKW
jgi:2-(3-amino-3-carboxypropyl)histidine synthase